MTQPRRSAVRSWLTPGIVAGAAFVSLASVACAPAGETSATVGPAVTGTSSPAANSQSPTSAGKKSKAAEAGTTNSSTNGRAPAPGTRDGAGQPQADDACSEERSWSAERQTGSTALTPASLYRVRAGQHGCYDRVVFDLNGPEDVGYSIAYTPLVRTDGDGEAVPVEGDAVLEVVVMGMVQGTDQLGHQPWVTPPSVGQDMVAREQLADWNALTQVAFAGSFEGQSTFAVGVRDQRPFRVWTSDQEQGYRRVVLDIAH